ncbi:MAG: LTA synthase family protein [Acidobacteria bacterium]|nr:LTA synthase family protein [Acidobacteriota bacterium]
MKHDSEGSSSSRETSRPRRLAFLLLPLVSTPLLYGTFWILDRARFGVRVDGPGWPMDLLLQLALGYVLLAFGRRGWLVVVEQALLMGLLYLGSAVKISLMGWPITPDDLGSGRELLRVLSPVFEVAAVAPIVLFAVAFLANLRLRRSSAVAAGACIAVWLSASTWPAAALSIVDHGVPHSLWNQRANYRNRGATLYLVSEALYGRIHHAGVPGRAEVAAAIAALRSQELPPPPVVTSATKRDLYVTVMESFWDPSLLSRAGFDRDPWFGPFRQLWREGSSWSMSPEFGGGTANPEFEVLCGIPTRLVLPGIVFKTSLENNVPCVPALLAARGWHTWAFHPNVPDFWNRSHAYRRVGFQRYLARPNLKLDDLNGPDLSDASLYRQALEHSKPWTTGHPAMTYIMTLTDHWPYPLNTRKRPALIHATSKVRDVTAYANSVYYCSRDLDHYVQTILSHDPSALIVALGDHLPVLGTKLAGYLESGFVPSVSTGQFSTRQAQGLTSTPLLVVDGTKGPLKVGRIAQFDLPRLILPKLGIEPPEWMRLMAPPHGWRVRTSPSLVLIIKPDGGEVLCRSPKDAPECRETASWLGNVKVLARDLVMGHQYTLKLTDE